MNSTIETKVGQYRSFSWSPKTEQIFKVIRCDDELVVIKWLDTQQTQSCERELWDADYVRYTKIVPPLSVLVLTGKCTKHNEV